VVEGALDREPHTLTAFEQVDLGHRVRIAGRARRLESRLARL
jgi:hypothetical protein